MPIMRKQQYRLQDDQSGSDGGPLCLLAIGATTIIPRPAGLSRGGRGHGLPRLAQAQLLRARRDGAERIYVCKSTS
jgi:hypothetical protein